MRALLFSIANAPKRLAFLALTVLVACSLEPLGNGKRTNAIDGGGDASTSIGGTPELFASGQASLSEIVIGKEDVVWTADNEVRACGKSVPCANPRTLVESDELSGYVRLAGNDVFYTTGPASGGGAVRRCDLPACKYNAAIQYGLGRLGDLAPDANDTFFLHIEDRRVIQCATYSDCTPKVIAKNVAVGGRIAVDTTHVFWTAPPPDNAIFRALRSGGNAADSPLVPFASDQKNALSIAIDQENVYWATVDDGAVRTCPVTGCNGVPREIAKGQAAPRSVVVDAGNLYWVNSGANTVVRCPLAGCEAPEIVAKDVATPVSLAVDATHLYVAARGANAIVRIAK